jgi:hypothetical protein
LLSVGDDGEERWDSMPDAPIARISEDDEVPEADALDQARPVRPTAEILIQSIPDDVPEADALDQARVVPLDDDERYESP